ncbi:MAG: ATP-binding protein [Planctomycetes bacterium]|nr:ATP-binding protein [Planctomycetota bacterium]
MKVLAAVQNGVEEALRSEGVDLVVVSSEGDIEDAITSEPALLLIDESLEFAHELVIRLKAEVDGPDRDRVPVLVVAPGPRQFRCVPDLVFEGGTPAAEVVKAGKELVLRRARQRRLFDQAADLLVPTTPEDIERAGEVVELLIDNAGFSVEDAVKLAHSVREAIGNAAEHGNKNDAERTVRIRYLRSADRVAIVVSDEGPGFDTKAFLARADQTSALEHTRSRRDTEERPGGIGVFIMRETCDDIRFNQEGNMIYLMKLLPEKE